MRKYTFFNFLAIAGIFIGFALMTSCEGPQGVEGPAGPEGPQGDDGTPGVAGTAVCLECHNLDKKEEITAEYNTSQHAAGATVGYAGNRPGCTKCHSNEGFILTERSGLDEVAEGTILNATPITCMTCHDFHETLDFENDGPDYAMRTNDPVTLLIDETTTLDLGDNSNLCANCHQPRRPAPDAAIDSTSVTSTHYGPHYGTQSTMLEGMGGYEIAGSVSYPTGQSTHRAELSCTSCHMNEANHSWNPDLNVCTDCHDGATDFDVNNFQTDIDGLMVNLRDKLVDAGLLAEDAGDYHPVVGKFPTDEVGALFNYLILYSDHSKGVHNPDYAEALVRNSLEVFN